jgi:mannose-1-phosphate guanylyltransferase / mannose-6-phosphate isomerase
MMNTTSSTTSSQLHHLILAGGGGTRLWPLSRSHKPKQFLSLGVNPAEAASLLCQTVLRTETAHRPLENHVYMVTGSDLSHAMKTDLANHGLEGLIANVIVEPSRKNTAPAIALAAQFILEKTGGSLADTILAILPADHLVADATVFQAHLQQAESLAKEGYIVTLGVPATYPETGYGYIEVGQDYSQLDWLEAVRFVEKPNEATAQNYVDSGRYLWNAGIFVLSCETLYKALALHAPEIHNLVSQGYQHAYERFEQMQNISFDYAVMEHAKKVAVVPMRTDWNDIGSWDSLQQLLTASPTQTDDQNNRWIYLNNGGHGVAQESSNCLVWSHTNRAIGLLGLEGITVVDTPDALLISKSGSSQSVKQVVDALSAVSHTSLHAPSSGLASWGQWEQIVMPEAGEPTVFKVVLLAEETLQFNPTGAEASITLLSGSLELVGASQQAILHQPLQHQVLSGEGSVSFNALTPKVSFLLATEALTFPLMSTAQATNPTPVTLSTPPVATITAG